MKIAISIGHTLTGIGSGAVGILNESICNRDVANKVCAYLKSLGHNVVLLRIDSSTYKSYDYVTRCKMANDAVVDLFVEIHFNCGCGNGTEVFAVSSAGKVYAQKVVDQIALLGFTNRGVKYGSGLYVLNNTKAPSILVECCFVDSLEDSKKYNADAFARAIVKGITGKDVVALQSYVVGSAKWIQSQLNKYGYALVVDGDIGTESVTAIKDFQKKHSLSIDGIVGPNTIKLLKLA
jgi:N-acetylmuramoyl-L-alanine amidase